MTKPLFFKSEPIIGESIQGYLSRLGKAFNCNSHSWVFDVFPDRFPNKRIRELLLAPDLRFLSDALQISSKKLDAMRLPQSGKNRYICRGQTLGPRDIRPSTSLYCPLCVRMHGTHLLIWNLSFVTACPTHNCALISHCPHCKYLLDIDSIKRNTCRRCHSRITAPVCNDPRLSLVIGKILSKIGGVLGNNTQCDLPELFETADISTVLSTIFCLGRATETSRRKGRSSSRSTIGALLIDGFSICENWDERFQLLLESEDNKERSQWSTRFGSFRQHFTRSKDPTIRRMSAAAISRYREFTALNRVDPGIDVDSHVILREVVQFLGISERSLKNRLSEVHLVPVRRVRAGTKIYVHVDEVERIRRSFSDCMTCHEAAKLLGIDDRHLIRALFRDRVFPHAATEVVLDERARMFQRLPIEGFCDRISLLDEREMVPDVEVSWRSAKALFMSRHRRSVEFHRLVVNNKLNPVARLPQTQGFPSLIFLSSDVKELEYEPQPRLGYPSILDQPITLRP
jgi:predicted DNA-binding protein (UPF0251 family)